MTDPTPLEDAPLLSQDPLIELEEVKPRRRPHHWVVFILTCAVSFAPLAAGLLFGVASIVGAFHPDGLFPWWAALIGLTLIILCLSGPIMSIYGIAEVDRVALWTSMIFAILSWPGVAVAIFFLTYVVPEEPVKAELCTSSAVADPSDPDCIWN